MYSTDIYSRWQQKEIISSRVDQGKNNSQTAFAVFAVLTSLCFCGVISSLTQCNLHSDLFAETSFSTMCVCLVWQRQREWDNRQGATHSSKRPAACRTLPFGYKSCVAVCAFLICNASSRQREQIQALHTLISHITPVYCSLIKCILHDHSAKTGAQLSISTFQHIICPLAECHITGFILRLHLLDQNTHCK